MQTLQKPKGLEEKSRRSSTCQPGSVSIKYSDMLLVDPTPSFSSKFPQFLVAVVVAEILGIEGGFEIVAAETIDLLLI